MEQSVQTRMSRILRGPSQGDNHRCARETQATRLEVRINTGSPEADHILTELALKTAECERLTAELAQANAQIAEYRLTKETLLATVCGIEEVLRGARA